MVSKIPKKYDSGYMVIFYNSYVLFYILYCLFGFNQVFRDRVPFEFIFSYWFLYPYIYSFYSNKFKFAKPIFIIFFMLKIYTSTNMAAAYYENNIFETTTINQRQKLLELK